MSMIEGIGGEVNEIVAGVTALGQGAVDVVKSEEFTALPSEYAAVESLANELADRIGALASRTMERCAALEPYTEDSEASGRLLNRIVDVAEGTAEGGPLDKITDKILSVERVVGKLTNDMPQISRLLREEARSVREAGKIIGIWGTTIGERAEAIETGVPKRLQAIDKLADEWRAKS